MNRLKLLITTLALILSSLACAIPERILDLDIRVPTIEVGDDRDESHSFPLPGTDSAQVDIHFGAGVLQLVAGAPEDLLSGAFYYNVPRWAPEFEHEGNTLTIRQGGDEGRWGLPSGRVRNRWDLALSPQVPLTVNLRAGAGEGELNFTHLQVAALDANVGAGSFGLRFDEPNPVPMAHLNLDTGASRITLEGVGNASPDTMTLKGGVGEMSVDLTGAWARSAEVQIRAGAGALDLRLPEDVGVQVDVRKGLANVEAYGLRQMGSTYTNDRFGETDITLSIDIVAGVGSVRLVVEGATE